MVIETDRVIQTTMTRFPETATPVIGVFEPMERPLLGPRLPQDDLHDDVDVTSAGEFDEEDTLPTDGESGGGDKPPIFPSTPDHLPDRDDNAALQRLLTTDYGIEVRDVGNDIIVIGSGEIGDKARKLIEETESYREVGFKTPPRFVLAEDFLDLLFQQNNLGNGMKDVDENDIKDRLGRSELHSTQAQILADIIEVLAFPAVMVRSSGMGDARGTGAYTSEAAQTSLYRVKRGLQNVVASYFSEDAKLFRRDTGVEEGFGVIIEPLVGQVLYGDLGEQALFAPVISGFGYTSTPREPNGYVVAVPGLGGGVSTREGERITSDRLTQLDPLLRDLNFYLNHYSSRIHNRVDELSESSLMIPRLGIGESEYYDSLVYFLNSDYPDDLNPDKIALNRQEMDPLFSRISLDDLFSQMTRAGESVGSPKYFEYAITVEQGQQQAWLLQVADVNKIVDFVDFEDSGEMLLEGNCFVGTGMRDCDYVVSCLDKNAIEALERFNLKHHNYVLLYSSNLIGRGVMGRTNEITYGKIYNAAVLIEVGGKAHTTSIVSHWEGELEATGKFLGSIALRDVRGEFIPQVGEYEGLELLQRPVKVAASEAHNKLTVSIGDGDSPKTGLADCIDYEGLKKWIRATIQKVETVEDIEEKVESIYHVYTLGLLGHPVLRRIISEYLDDFVSNDQTALTDSQTVTVLKLTNDMLSHEEGLPIAEKLAEKATAVSTKANSRELHNAILTTLTNFGYEGTIDFWRSQLANAGNSCIDAVLTGIVFIDPAALFDLLPELHWDKELEEAMISLAHWWPGRLENDEFVEGMKTTLPKMKKKAREKLLQFLEGEGIKREQFA